MFDPIPIRAVVFDLDGVLYDFQPEARTLALAAATGLEPGHIAPIFTSAFETEAEAGAFATGEAYLAAFNQALGCALTREEWIEARRVAMRPRPGMIQLARDISSRLPAGVLTNNGALLRDALPELAPVLAEIMGPRCWVSCEFGARKPEPRVFQRMTDRLGLPPASVLFVDDSAANCEGAAVAGLQALQFDEAQSVVTRVRGLVGV